MTPAARLKTLVHLTDMLLSNKKPADAMLKYFFKNNRYIGSSDRRFLKDHLYGIIRHFYRLQDFCSQNALKSDALHITCLYLIKVNILNDQNLDTFTSGSPHAFQKLPQTILPFLNEKPALSKDIFLECPKWLQHAFKDMPFSAMLEKPSLTIRANTLKTNRKTLLKKYGGQNIDAVRTNLSPFGLTLKNAPLLEQSDLFKEGLFEIQDEGSQLLALLCNPRPNDKVLDYCAGAAGKTLALAALMQNKGRIIATDIDEKRLERGVRRLKRAGVSNTQNRVLNRDTNTYLKKHKGFFDLVLVDAPCSGTGTWRRNPEARLFLNEQRLQELVNLQKEILEKAWPLVKPGGTLVYATCSMLPQENEDQITHFLKDTPCFEPVILEHIESLPETLRTQTPYLKLTPHTHHTDGFFGCVLRRKK